MSVNQLKRLWYYFILIDGLRVLTKNFLFRWLGYGENFHEEKFGNNQWKAFVGSKEIIFLKFGNK